MDPIDPFFHSGAWMREYPPRRGELSSEQTAQASRVTLKGGCRT